MGGEDKSLFYQANTFGIIGKLDKKISNLLDIVNNYPNSKYTTKAIFEIGTSYELEKTTAKQYSISSNWLRIIQPMYW
jgi:hypothetical protein